MVAASFIGMGSSTLPGTRVLKAPSEVPRMFGDSHRLQHLSSAAVSGLRTFRIVSLRASAVHRSSRKFRISCSADASDSPDTLATVRKIIAKQLAVETLAVLPSSKFSDLGADSLDTVEIMMALEEEFKITLDEDGAERIATVQEAADLIEQVIAANSSPV